MKTSKYMADAFKALGYELTMAEGITGFCTTIDTGKVGPTVLILGELDSIICPNHPESDKETGAVHSCGHNAQCAALLGVAYAAILDKNMAAYAIICAVGALISMVGDLAASGIKRNQGIKDYGNLIPGHG